MLSLPGTVLQATPSARATTPQTLPRRLACPLLACASVEQPPPAALPRPSTRMVPDSGSNESFVSKTLRTMSVSWQNLRKGSMKFNEADIVQYVEHAPTHDTRESINMTFVRLKDHAQHELFSGLLTVATQMCRDLATACPSSQES